MKSKKEKDTVSVTIELPKDVHLAVVLKQIKKFDKGLTVPEICALAVAKGLNKV